MHQPDLHQLQIATADVKVLRVFGDQQLPHRRSSELASAPCLASHFVMSSSSCAFFVSIATGSNALQPASTAAWKDPDTSSRLQACLQAVRRLHLHCMLHAIAASRALASAKDLIRS